LQFALRQFDDDVELSSLDERNVSRRRADNTDDAGLLILCNSAPQALSPPQSGAQQRLLFRARYQRDYFRAVKSMTSRAVRDFLPKASHMPMFEVPELLAAVLKTFLSGVESPVS
jgi:pimeloyl-ACP methyl ester carboxylesterase